MPASGASAWMTWRTCWDAWTNDCATPHHRKHHAEPPSPFLPCTCRCVHLAGGAPWLTQPDPTPPPPRRQARSPWCSSGRYPTRARRSGGRSRSHGWSGVTHCEVTLVEAPSQLAYRWGNGTESANGLITHITWTLQEHGGGTLLRMEQAGFRPNHRISLERLEQVVPGH